MIMLNRFARLIMNFEYTVGFSIAQIHFVVSGGLRISNHLPATMGKVILTFQHLATPL